MEIIRTEDSRFTGLAGYGFEPHFLELGSEEDGALRMHYLDEGPSDGEVFLLVHGEPTWSYLYRNWIGRLSAAGFRCIVPDHVGFGRSDKVVDDDWYTIDRHVANLDRLVQALDLRRINLFCQDWGGPISLRIACGQPERFERLFIGNTWLHHEGYEYTPRILQWRELATDPERAGGDMPVGFIVSMGLRRRGHDTEAIVAAYDAPFTGIESKAGPRRFPYCLPFAEPELGGAAWQAECYERLRSWESPVHFIWGDADDVFTIEWGEQWASVIPGSTLDRIAGSGHFLQEDAASECVDAILGRID